MPLAELARRPKVRRWLGIAAAAVAVYALMGVFAVPPPLRSLLAGKLTQALHPRTTVEAVSFNPFALSVRVRGLTVREPGSDTVFVSLGELDANIKLTSILRLAPVLKELRLADLHVHLVRITDAQGTDLLALPLLDVRIATADPPPPTC